MNPEQLLTLLLLLTPVHTLLTTPQEQSPDSSCPELKDALSRLILKFLENLRAHMDTGIPSMGIPPLDPLRINDTQYFHVHKPYQVEVKGDVSNTVVENLSKFNVTAITTSLLHMQANMTLQIPYFILSGSYSLKGRLMSVFPVQGSGPYAITPSNITTTVQTTLTIHHKRLQLTSLQFNFDFLRLFVNLKGLYGGGHLGHLINTLANRFGVAIYHKVEPRIHDTLRLQLIYIINQKLQDIPLAELISAGSYGCQAALLRAHPLLTYQDLQTNELF